MKLLTLLYLLISPMALAGAGVSLQGQLLKPDSFPVNASAVIFKVQLRSPGASNCLLYEETQTIDMSHSSGYFTLTLNGSGSTRTDAGLYSFERILQNRGTFNLPSACTYVAGLTDERKVVLSFNDGSGFEAFPAFGLTPAAQAVDSYSVGGFAASSLLRAVDSVGEPTTIAAFTPSQITSLLNFLSTGDAGGFTGALGGDVTGTQGTNTVERIRGVNVSNGALTSGQSLVYDGTEWTGGVPTSFSGLLSGDVSGGQSTTSVTKLRGVNIKSGTLTAGQSLIYDGSQWAASTPSDFNGVLSGDVTGTQGATVVSKLAGTSLNISSPTAGQILKYDGVDWIAGADAGITSLTIGSGLTGGPTITSSGSIAVDTGTSSGKIVQLDGSARLPAVDGSQLTNLPFKNRIIYDSSGSWNVPAGVTQIYVQAWGGGGGGGGASASVAGSGGGAGAYASAFFTVSSGSLAVTIGGGGLGGNGTAGTAGNATSLAALISAGGGTGGVYGLGVAAGGTSTAYENIAGGIGSPGAGGTLGIGGLGGSAPQGGSGGPGGYSIGSQGSVGTTPGGGGGGGFSNGVGGTKGGNGASGRLIIWY